MVSTCTSPTSKQTHTISNMKKYQSTKRRRKNVQPPLRDASAKNLFASIPFLMLGICLCFDGWSEKGRKVARIVAWVLVALSAVCFIILLPYACGIAVPAGWLDLGKKLLRIWY